MISSKLILAVDDSEFDRGVMQRAISPHYSFIDAKDGSECLDLVSRRKIDLILLDLAMPGIDGMQVLSEIRKKYNAIELPVIIVSSKIGSADVVNCLHIGANDHIAKPFNFNVALSRINTHLKVSELSQELSRAKEKAALHAMIHTYNHEINTPLSVAIGYLGESSNEPNSEEIRDNVRRALWKVAEIVKKISLITERKEMTFQGYTSTSKMLKIK